MENQINYIPFIASTLFLLISFIYAVIAKITLFDLWLNLIKGFLNFVSAVFNGIEKSLIDLICVVVPYATPLVPSYLTFDNAQTILGLPAWVAWTVAFVFEGLGLASVATAVRFWRHNKKHENRGAANQAPFSAVRNIYIAYLFVVILVNVVLEWKAGTRDALDIVTIAALSVLSFPASSLVAYRQLHSDILEEKAERKAGGTSTQNKNEPKEKNEKHASDHVEKIITMLNKAWTENNRVLTPKEITTALKLNHDNNKGYVSTLTTKWRNEKGIAKPDNKKDGLTF